ncbi:hypothetical protein K1719_016394 [Acacia pycnantha]|nr:hypothetical protein K1719_016394 [Acacia pycnantha]
MGRQLSYGFMVKKLRMLWARKGEIDVFDLENEFYLVNFQQHDDYMDALIGGPWVIADAYLNVSRWRPEFDPKKASIDSVVAWVRLPDLPAPLFDKKFLLSLGNSIGKAIRLDVHTAQRARGKFARMCVELDLTKPLIPEFSVEGRVLSVVYESLGVICQQCGKVGHKKEQCEAIQKRKQEGEMEIEIVRGEEAIETEKMDVGGRWKTVIKPRRPRNVDIKPTFQQGGSRFNVLRDESVIEKESIGEERVKQNAPTSNNVEGVLPDGGGKHQRNFDLNVGRGTGFKKPDSIGGGGKGKMVVEGRKDGDKKAANMNNSGFVVASRGGGVLKPFAANRGWNPEGISATQRNQGVQAVGKENLKPGGISTKMRSAHDMKTDEAITEMEDDNPMASVGVSMEEECHAPKPAVLEVDVIAKNEQFVHCRVWCGGENVLFTAVYASPNEQKRRELWEILQGMATDIEEPWMCVGDYNEIRSPLEQKGGGRVSESRCDRFNEWIQRCNLIDVEAKGPFFTWKGPKWEGLDRVYKKLDRCLCNVSWLEKFEGAEARILPRVFSDHHPIFINLMEDVQSIRGRNFKFQLMWQMHEGFNELIQQSWRGDDEIHKKIVTLQQDLMVWNREVFGQIEGRKRRILNRKCELSKECKALQADSELWRHVARLWPVVVNNACWEVGDGKTISFWNDKWLEGGRKLSEMCLGELSEIDGGEKVADMVGVARCRCPEATARALGDHNGGCRLPATTEGGSLFM